MLDEQKLSPENNTLQRQKRFAIIGYWTIIILFGSLAAYSAIRRGGEIGFDALFSSSLLPFAAVLALVIASRNRLKTALWTLALTWWIGTFWFLFTLLNTPRTGFIMEPLGSLLGLIIISIMAWNTVSNEVRNRVVVVGALVSVALYALILLRPAPVIEATDFVKVIMLVMNLILGAVGLAAIAFMIRNLPNLVQSYFQQSLRNKLLITLLGITTLSTLTIGVTLVVLSARSLSVEVQADRLSNLTAVEQEISIALEGALTDVLFMTKSVATQNYMETIYSTGSDISQADVLADLEREIFEFTASRAVYEEVRYIDETGQEIIRVNRARSGTGYYLVPRNELQDKGSRYYFVDSIDLPEGSLYISPLDLTVERGEIVVPHLPVIRFATPVIYEGKVRGIMIVNVYADSFLDFISEIAHPVFLSDADGQFLYHPNSDFEFSKQLETDYNVQTEYPEIFEHLLEGEVDIETLAGTFYAHIDMSLPQQDTLAWSLVLYEPISIVFAPIYDEIWVSLWIFLLVLLVTSVISVLLALQISRPLLELTNITGQIAQGDYDVRAVVVTGDEIGELGKSVNNMAEQVGELVRDIAGQRDVLEQRAIEMEASQRVTFAASERTTPEDFLNLVVNLIRDVFDMYHAQVYLLSEDKTTAELRESSGYAGRMLLQRRHAIPMERASLVTTAIKTAEAVLVAETENDPNWLPNELLPETKSELVIPLVLEGEVLGALDIQSRIPGFFTERSIPLFQQMTNQIAFLFDNASLISQIENQTGSLEQFADQLRISAEIAARLNTINNLDDLLEEAVNQLQVRFNFYHAHVYMPDEKNENLVVQAGSGHVGYTLKRNKHSIPMNSEGSMVARAARERQPIVEDDVTLAEGFFANPLLPNTHSEAAIPLMLGDRLIGVLDLQDENISRFTQADVDTLQTLAGQIASSIESAQFFEDVQEAQVRFQTVADYTFDWETWLSEEEEYLYCSPSIERITGYMPNELIEQPSLFVDMVEEIDKKLVQEHVHDHRSTADADAIEYRITTKSGERRWIRHACQAVYDAEGAWIGRRGSNSDITDRKLADVARVQSEERMRSIVEIAPDAIITMDDKQNIVLFNKGAEIIFGYTAAEVEGQPLTMLMPPNSQTVHGPEVGKFRGEETRAREMDSKRDIFGRRKNGEIFPAEAGISKIELEGRIFYTAFLRDITERQAAQSAIVQGDRLKSEFLANMSHELRTPLNSIIGYTDVLLMGLDGELDEEVQEDIQAIHDNGQHLLSLINDVLDLAKIEAGRMTLESKKVDVKGLLEELHKKNAGLILNKKVEMKLDIAKGLPNINGDAHRLNQVLTNLISNAVKFTEKGSITIKAFEDKKAIVMQVIDTGIGIEEQDLKEIFEEFTQVDASFSRRAEGTGLGLTITQNLVKMHGGTMTVESKLGKGSTFSVSIPVDNTIKPEYTVATPVKVNGNKPEVKKSGSAIA